MSGGVLWSSISNGLIMPREFADYFAGPSQFSRFCGFCRAFHPRHMSCPCFRCGHRHEGDCVSVCKRCHRSHPANSSQCRIIPTSYFSARSRDQAVFSNDTDGHDRSSAPQNDLGDMSIVCPHCHSRSWLKEKISCCHGGDVVVDWDHEVPSELRAIILSSHVRQNIRRYNTVMAFASTGHDSKKITASESNR
jgi:hypothetical protein